MRSSAVALKKVLRKDGASAGAGWSEIGQTG